MTDEDIEKKLKTGLGKNRRRMFGESDLLHGYEMLKLGRCHGPEKVAVEEKFSRLR